MVEGESVWEMRGCFDFASYRYGWYSAKSVGKWRVKLGREREIADREIGDASSYTFSGRIREREFSLEKTHGKIGKKSGNVD